MSNNVSNCLNDLNEDVPSFKPATVCTTLSSSVTTINITDNSITNDEEEIASCSKLYSSFLQRPVTESKYEAYDNRPIRSLGKNFYKTFADSSFSCSTPLLSRSEPAVYWRKKAKQFMTQAANQNENLKEKVKSNRVTMDKASDISTNTPGRYTSTSQICISHLSNLDNAATCIQAAWRGYYCRNFLYHVKNAQLELRNQRAEKHINKLSRDLQRQQMQCNEKSNLLKQLIQIVQVLCDEFHQKNTSLNSFGVNYDKAATTKFQSEIDSLKESVNTLQKQVNQLHDTLHTFMAGSFKYFEKQHKDSPEIFLENSSLVYSGNGFHDGVWSYKILDCESNKENDLVNSDTEEPSQEVADPKNFSVASISKNSVVLSWNVVTSDVEDLMSNKLLGYKIYVNGQPIALVHRSHTRITVSNLNPPLSYKFNITTVSKFQESRMSPTINVVYCSSLDNLNVTDKIMSTHNGLERSNCVFNQHEKPDSMKIKKAVNSSSNQPSQFVTSNLSSSSMAFQSSSPSRHKNSYKPSHIISDRNSSPGTSNGSSNEAIISKDMNKGEQSVTKTLNSFTGPNILGLPVVDGQLQTDDNCSVNSFTSVETSGSDRKKMTVAETVEQYFLQCKRTNVSVDSNDETALSQANEKKPSILSDNDSTNPTKQNLNPPLKQERALSSGAEGVINSLKSDEEGDDTVLE